jgi:alanyl aminopeptidase
VFNALEEYFGIPYPFDKLDQIAFTFDGGAMENVGLITYGQSLLVAPPAADSPGRQREAATTIAHEIAHQWFGNSTTMQWWDDLWLNESFATWLELRVIDQTHPELNMRAVRQG